MSVLDPTGHAAESNAEMQMRVLEEAGRPKTVEGEHAAERGFRITVCDGCNAEVDREEFINDALPGEVVHRARCPECPGYEGDLQRTLQRKQARSAAVSTGQPDGREITNWTCKVCGALWGEQSEKCQDHALEVTPRVPVVFVPKSRAVSAEQALAEARSKFEEEWAARAQAEIALSDSRKELAAAVELIEAIARQTWRGKSDGAVAAHAIRKVARAFLAEHEKQRRLI